MALHVPNSRHAAFRPRRVHHLVGAGPAGRRVRRQHRQGLPERGRSLADWLAEHPIPRSDRPSWSASTSGAGWSRSASGVRTPAPGRSRDVDPLRCRPAGPARHLRRDRLHGRPGHGHHAVPTTADCGCRSWPASRSPTSTCETGSCTWRARPAGAQRCRPELVAAARGVAGAAWVLGGACRPVCNRAAPRWLRYRVQARAAT
jgi:hypothetical protein